MSLHAAAQKQATILQVDPPTPDHVDHDVRADLASGSRVLVIGGAGYVGSVLCGQLLASGHRVRVLDAFLYGRESLNEFTNDPRVEIIQSDSRDLVRVRAAMHDVSAVVHLGEIVGDPACSLDPEVTVDVNVNATLAVARLARDAGIRRFIYPSSCSVYGASDDIVSERSDLNPVSLYARAKITVEEALRRMADSDFQPVILRFATVYGLSPRPRFDLVVNLLTAKAQSTGEITVNGGDQWRPFVHVADAAAAILLMLQQPSHMVAGETFNVGSNDQNHTVGEVGEVIRNRVAGSTVHYGAVTESEELPRQVRQDPRPTRIPS